MKVYVIRHTSVDVPRGTCYGQTDVPVKSTFEAEAADVLSRLQPHLPVDKAYCSPLTRCVKLAAYCGFPDAERDDRLKEINMGEWEMKNYNDIVDPRIEDWYRDYIHVQVPGGESFVMQVERVSRFLDELRQKPYQKVAIFAHGGVQQCAQVYAGLVSMENPFADVQPYGSIVEIEI